MTFFFFNKGQTAPILQRALNNTNENGTTVNANQTDQQNTEQSMQQNM